MLFSPAFGHRRVNMKAIFLLGVVALAFAEAFGRECGENQHYSSCGTACPLTCDNYNNPPEACVLMCVPGCHCDKGYVKTSDGQCVKPEECPAKSSAECGENEHFESCGTACPLTCDNYRNPPKICVLRCDIGCHCDKGYVRSAEGRCVKPEECPASAQQVCGQNEQWNNCGTDCPLTCENYRDAPLVCNFMCKIGCECRSGFVRSKDGRCVRPEHCPAEAPLEQSCLEEPETGMCRGYFPMFHYDAKTGTCKRFVYGGCGGNGNRYLTEEACMKHCAGVEVNQASSACDLPADAGVCRGFFQKYYFDRTTGQCRRFVYGGCGGNDNNFETEEECEQQCGAQSAESLCELPVESGPCFGYMPRYHFDRTSGTCKKFIYGGCRGNANNFESLESCQETCA